MTGVCHHAGHVLTNCHARADFISSIRGCDTITFEALGRANFFGGGGAVSPIRGTFRPHLFSLPPTLARRVRHSRRHYDRHNYCGTRNRRWARKIYPLEVGRRRAPGLGGSPCTPDFSGSPTVRGDSGARSSYRHVFRHSPSSGQFRVCGARSASSFIRAPWHRADAT
jgi:hypothetical protein